VITGDEDPATAEWLREKAREIISRILSIAESSGIDPEPAGVNRLVEVLKAIGSSDERVTAFILFGSRARGDYRDDSDWDIAIVPSKPLNMEDLEEMARRIGEGLGVPLDKIDVVDLFKAPNELIYKVLRDGKPLFVRDWSLYRRFVLWKYIRVLDEEEGFTQTYFKRLRNKLK
jgi:predicted nucleotidyltransferase